MKMRKWLRDSLSGVISAMRYKWRLGSMGRRCSVSIKRLVGGKHIFLGDRVFILWGARLETACAIKGVVPELRIGNHVGIGQNFHCTCSKSITIGDYACCTANVTISDTHHFYEDLNTPPARTPVIADPVTIGPWCLIHNGAVILPGTHLGRHCIVGANSVVKGRFEDYSVIVGSPARVVRRYDPDKKEWVRVRD